MSQAAEGATERAAGGMAFAHDVNLGFPTNDPEWAAFFAEHGWRTAGYDDMGKLTETLRSHAAAAAFLPAANYFFLRDDPFYSGFASALAMKTGGKTVDSVLIVPKSSKAESIVDLKGKRLGYINLYCTTSYFSPAILLAEHGIPFKGFFSSLKSVGAWQRQIDALVAGEIDATMVEEGIWRGEPANAAATKIIGRIERLPGPLVVVAKTSTRRSPLHFWPGCSPRARRGQISPSPDTLRIARRKSRTSSTGAPARSRSLRLDGDRPRYGPSGFFAACRSVSIKAVSSRWPGMIVASRSAYWSAAAASPASRLKLISALRISRSSGCRARASLRTPMASTACPVACSPTA